MSKSRKLRKFSLDKLLQTDSHYVITWVKGKKGESRGFPFLWLTNFEKGY